MVTNSIIDLFHFEAQSEALEGSELGRQECESRGYFLAWVLGVFDLLAQFFDEAVYLVLFAAFEGEVLQATREERVWIGQTFQAVIIWVGEEIEVDVQFAKLCEGLELTELWIFVGIVT
jgi:hypothetical protein